MSEELCNWPGKSGHVYTYYVFDSTVDVPGRLGNFIYAKKTEKQRWSAVYVGCGDLSVRCNQDARLMQCIQAKGATHVHLRLNAGSAEAMAEMQDIIEANPSVFEPNGCHSKQGETCVWTGASGNQYMYYIYDRNEPMPARLGNYIYARRDTVGPWLPVYIGHGDLSIVNESNRRRMEGIDSKGASHLHLRLNHEESSRAFEVDDLLTRHKNAFEPHGCHSVVDGRATNEAVSLSAIDAQ